LRRISALVFHHRVMAQRGDSQILIATRFEHKSSHSQRVRCSFLCGTVRDAKPKQTAAQHRTGA
jgi:hypothetical protein